MQIAIHSRNKSDSPDWEDFVSRYFGDFLHFCYNGTHITPEKDPADVAIESINSDYIVYAELNNQVVGMSSYQFLGPNLEFKNCLYATDIAIHPDFRGKGIGESMRAKMLAEKTPDLLIGIANNPASVKQRQKALDFSGFETYWGNLPVVDTIRPIPDLETIGVMLISKIFPENAVKYTDGIIPYTETLTEGVWGKASDWLPQNSNLNTVLSRILELQKLWNTPAMAILISKKSS